MAPGSLDLVPSYSLDPFRKGMGSLRHMFIPTKERTSDNAKYVAQRNPFVERSGRVREGRKPNALSRSTD